MLLAKPAARHIATWHGCGPLHQPCRPHYRASAPAALALAASRSASVSATKAMGVPTPATPPSGTTMAPATQARRAGGRRRGGEHGGSRELGEQATRAEDSRMCCHHRSYSSRAGQPAAAAGIVPPVRRHAPRMPSAKDSTSISALSDSTTCAEKQKSVAISVTRLC